MYFKHKLACWADRTSVSPPYTLLFTSHILLGYDVGDLSGVELRHAFIHRAALIHFLHRGGADWLTLRKHPIRGI